MMSVKEYALSMNYTVAEVLKKSRELGIKIGDKDSILSEDDIVMLDITLAVNNEDEEITDDSEVLLASEDEMVSDEIKSEKLKKKSSYVSSKSEFDKQKKQTYISGNIIINSKEIIAHLRFKNFNSGAKLVFDAGQNGSVQTDIDEKITIEIKKR